MSGKTLDLDRVLELARHYPDEVQTLPCTPDTVELVRENAKRDAQMRVPIPDEWVRQMRTAETAPLVFCIFIPRRVYDLSQSRIVLPTERPQPRRRRKP